MLKALWVVVIAVASLPSPSSAQAPEGTVSRGIGVAERPGMVFPDRHNVTYTGGPVSAGLLDIRAQMSPGVRIVTVSCRLVPTKTFPGNDERAGQHSARTFQVWLEAPLAFGGTKARRVSVGWNGVPVHNHVQAIRMRQRDHDVASPTVPNRFSQQIALVFRPIADSPTEVLAQVEILLDGFVWGGAPRADRVDVKDITVTW